MLIPPMNVQLDTAFQRDRLAICLVLRRIIYRSHRVSRWGAFRFIAARTGPYERITCPCTYPRALDACVAIYLCVRGAFNAGGIL